jgi:hypothetical protein
MRVLGQKTHKIVCALIVASFGVVVSSAFARGPYGSIKVGNWTGGGYTNDTTGQFNGCTAGATYLDGTYFMVSVSAADSWSLGFANPSWQLVAGQSFPIDLTFDGQHQFHVFGTPITRSLVSVPMPNNSALINAFRKSQGMAAYTQGKQFQFQLPATSVLLPTLVNCVKQIKENGLASAGDFTIRSPKTEQVATNAGSTLKPETNQPQALEYQVEAVQLASNFLIKAQLQNAHIVDRSEMSAELASYGAAWRSEEAAGFVRIIPTTADVKGLDVAATVIGNDAKACKGKFASGRMSELVDSDVVFLGLASCEDSDGSRIAQYFIVPRKKGGFVMFSVQSNMKTEQARDVTKDDRLGGFRKAALVAVTQ